MRAIIAVFTNSPISIIMVGCTECLRTFSCWLCPCVCTHIFSCVRVSGGHSDILHRFSFGCQSFMDVCLVIWKSVLSGCLSSTALLLILSVLRVFSGSLVDILVLKIQVWWISGGSLYGVFSCNPLYFLCLVPRNGESVLDYFGTIASVIVYPLILVFYNFVFYYAYFRCVVGFHWYLGLFVSHFFKCVTFWYVIFSIYV